MYKKRICKLLCISLILSMFSVLKADLITATDDSLLLLSYEDIDSQHFAVKGALRNMPAINVISLPVAFNPKSVSICGFDSQTGAFLDITDGVKKAADFKDGLCGFLMCDALLDKWGALTLENDLYPYISNSEGILKATFYSMKKNKNAFAEEADAFKIYFKRIGEEPPDIRIATINNTEYYDEAAPYGVAFFGGGEIVEVNWSYSGDVFDLTSETEPIIPEEPPTDEPYEGDLRTDNPSGNGASDKSPSGGTSSDNNASDSKAEENRNTGSSDGEKNGNVSHSGEFFDVPAAHWAYEYVSRLTAMNVINGRGNGIFSPDEPVTRAELTKMAVAALGIEASASEIQFADCDNEAWYARYISAAYNSGLIQGFEDGSFRPNDNISRQDICTILYRACFKDSEAVPMPSFADGADVSDYAAAAVARLHLEGILSGRGDNMIVPKASATRAETAKLVMLCLDKNY